MNYTPNSSRGDVMPARDRTLTFAARDSVAYDLNIAFGKFGKRVITSSAHKFRASLSVVVNTPRFRQRLMRSAFSGHVLHVVSLCSQKQMFWVNTRRVVAFVQNAQGLIKRAMVHLVRESMGTHALPFRSTDDPVTLRVYNACPDPAAACVAHLNVSPKTVLDWYRSALIGFNYAGCVAHRGVIITRSDRP